MAYNTSVHASSGYTPFYLLYGREARLPIDLMYGTKRPSLQSVHEYASHLKQSLNDAYSAVRQQLNQAHARQKQYYDRKVHGEPYKKRDLVWLHNPNVPPGQSAKLMHPWTGSEARLPIDLMYGTKRPSLQSVHEYASHLKQSLNDAYSAVRQQLNQAHARQKQYYDRKVHGEPHKKRDLVWLHNPNVPPGQSAKLMHPWTGPYRIVERLSEVDYRIQELFGKKTPSVVHFDRLKRCHPDTRFPDQDTSDDAPQDQPENLTLYSHLDMELIEPDAVESAPLRRSTRNRQQPNRYKQMILHQVEFGTNSS